MENRTSLIPVGKVERLILSIRGQRVMLDADLALLYGVSTKRLNEQVKRNIRRFPDEFMFQLTADEKNEVVAICDHLKNLKYSSSLPHAFTEHGAIMLASILNSERAVEVSIYVVRAFIKLNKMLHTHAELARRINNLEKKYDVKFKAIFEAIRQLMTPPEKLKRKIGFRGDE